MPPERYFLTFGTHRRTRLFTDAEAVDLVMEQIRYTAHEQSFEVLAYCFMPDHLHLFACGATQEASLTAFVNRTKQRAGWRFNRTRRRRLWQEGYYEHVVRSDESTQDVIRYIVNNPLRAGLVSSLQEYPFWGSLLYSREEILEFIGRPPLARGESRP